VTGKIDWSPVDLGMKNEVGHIAPKTVNHRVPRILSLLRFS